MGELVSERDVRHTPLFQVMFALYEAPQSQENTADELVEAIRPTLDVAKFELTLSVENLAGRGSEGPMVVMVEYMTDLFRPATMRGFVGCYQTLLQAVVDDAERPIDDLDLITAEERRELLQRWVTPDPERQRDATVPEVFAAACNRDPELIAMQEGDFLISYGELDERTTQLAHWLVARGAGPEVSIAICMPSGAQAVIALLGVIKAGSAYAPLDPEWPASRTEYILEDTRSPLVLTLADLAGNLMELATPVFAIDTGWAEIAATERQVLPLPDPDNIAYVIFTSGSTGTPKGVQVNHGNLIAHVTAWKTLYQPVPSDRMIQFAAFTFDVFVQETFCALLNGIRLVHRSEDMIDPRALVARCEEWGITILDMPTTAWHELAARLGDGSLTLPDSIRLVVTGGEAAILERAEQWRDNVRPGVQVINMYGPTEITIASNAHDIASLPPGPLDFVPIGAPLPSYRVVIADDQIRPVPAGVPGELLVGGPSLTRGYLNRPDLAAERFIPDPFSGQPGARLYRTGDLVRSRQFEDGNPTIEFIDRIDFQVKVRGYRIELREIESCIRDHEAVEDAVVIVYDKGMGNRQLVAYVVPQDDIAMEVGTITNWVGEHLPSYMIPAAVVFLSELPKNSHDKIDRKALPAPEFVAGTGYEAPRNDREARLAEIWSEILSVARVGIRDNFFELGGDSMASIRVIGRAGAEGLDLSPKALFENPTVAQLAAVLEESERAEPIPALSREAAAAPLPLSFGQLRLWFLQQLAETGALYNIPSAIAMEGSLDTDLFQKALALLAERQEVLRTTIEVYEGKPVLVIHPPGEVPMPVEELRHLPEDERRQRVFAEIAGDARRPFALHESLWRVRLLRTGDASRVLFFTLHHIISDGWSMEIFIGELAEIYAALLEKREPILPRLPVQYADFSVWQREGAGAELMKDQLAYWQEQLMGAPALHGLPTDRARPANPTFRGAGYHMTIEPETTERVRRLGLERGTSMFMTLLAVFKVLVYRYSGREDIVVGSPIANRDRNEVQNLIGFFVNMLALRTGIDGRMSFLEVLAQVKETVLGGFTNQMMPFEQIVEALDIERDLSHNPLIQLVFALHKNELGEFSVPGLVLTPMADELVTAKFDLSLGFLEVDGRLQGGIEYSTDLFDEPTIARMGTHYTQLLEAVLADPEAIISRLQLSGYEPLPAEEEVTAQSLPRTCLHRLFEARAAQTPDAKAVLAIGEDTTLTYHELEARANQLAHSLAGRGIAPGAIVALCMERAPEMITAMLAILKAGAAYLPLDAGWPDDRLRFMLADAGVSVLLANAAVADLLPKDLTAEVLLVDAHWQQTIADEPATPLELDLHTDLLAYVIYTSGSTGQPKGVAISHTAAVNFTRHALDEYDLDASDRVLQFASISFDTAVEEIYPCLGAGATLVLRDGEMIGATRTMLAACEAHGITVLDLPTAYWHQLTADIADEDLALPADLRLVILGGERARPEVLRVWQRRTGDFPLLINTYGPTETCVIATSHEPELPADWDAPLTEIPIGLPVSNAWAYILDSHLQPVPVGVPGELHLAGQGLARGYLARPDLTADRFIPNPFVTAAGLTSQSTRLYRTGDLARYLATGTIEFQGRVDNQVKIRGFRVELGEIEAALQQHEAVTEAAVLFRANKAGTKQLVAFAIADVEAANLRAYLVDHLPGYMVPAAIQVLEKLPMTSSGKLDRRALAGLEIEAAGEVAAYVVPRNEKERILAEVWCDVLGLERVGIHDNFFEIGGDSILSIQILARARKQNLMLTPKDVFANQTIAKMATVAVQSETGSQQGEITGIVPLTPLQMEFLLLAAPHQYIHSLTFNLPNQVTADHIEKALADLLVQHDALRMSFESLGDTWLQSKTPVAEEVPFETIDLTGVDQAALAMVLTQVSAAIRVKMDPVQGPQIRLALLRLTAEGEAGENLLVLAANRLVVDEGSLHILIADLEQAIRAFGEGRQPQWPAKTTAFKDWSDRMTEAIDDFKGEIDHWLAVAEADALRLATEPEEEPIAPADLVTHAFDLDEARATALQDRAHIAYNTRTEDLILAALATALAGGDAGNVVLTLEAGDHGATAACFAGSDLGHSIGQFQSRFPLLLVLPPADEAGDLITAIKEQRRTVPNSGLGYGLLRAYGGHIGAPLHHLPVPEIAVNCYHEPEPEGLLTLCDRSPRFTPFPPGQHMALQCRVSGAAVQVTLLHRPHLPAQQAEDLVTRFRQKLEQLVDHCCSQQSRTYTPSDFPLAGIDAAALKRLTTAHGEIQDLYRLSPMQEGMFFHTLADDRALAYQLQTQFRIDGPLDEDLFQQALSDVVARHTVVRSSFHWAGLEKPLQLVHSRLDLPWHREDWTHLSEDEALVQFDAFLHRDWERGMHFGEPPWFRFALFQVTPNLRYFMWTYHHLLLDGWSMILVFQEITARYGLLAGG